MNYTEYVDSYTFELGLNLSISEIELFGPKHNEKFVIFSDFFASIGIMTVSGIAYAIRDHELFIIATSVPILCTIPLIW